MTTSRRKSAGRTVALGLSYLWRISDRANPKDSSKNVKNTTVYCPLQTALEHRWSKLTRRQTKELNPGAVFTLLGMSGRRERVCPADPRSHHLCWYFEMKVYGSTRLVMVPSPTAPAQPLPSRKRQTPSSRRLTSTDRLCPVSRGRTSSESRLCTRCPNILKFDVFPGPWRRLPHTSSLPSARSSVACLRRTSSRHSPRASPRSSTSSCSMAPRVGGRSAG